MERNKPEENELRNKLGKGLGEITQNWIQGFLKQIAERLEKMEEELAVDRIEGNIAVCENIKTKEIHHINLSELPKDIKEGSILKWKNDKYELEESSEIEKRIEQKMKDVWE